MKNLFLILLLSINSLAYAETVKFNESGFSIDILDEKPSNAGSQPLQMLLPAVNGFSANVNVQIQPYPGTLEEYKKLSEAQFIQLGLKTIASSTRGSAVVFEYSGFMMGNELHFYAKAIKKGNLFYLATATDLDSEWHKNSSRLKSIVNSFVLE